jgi:hypothetical protein
MSPRVDARGVLIVILGMSTPTFTLFHVLISLVAMLAGVFVMQGMIRSKPEAGWTALFLATLVLTSVTGFFFPSNAVTPGQIVGALSLVALAAAILAFYGFHCSGAWRWIYVIGAVAAFFFDVFVGIAQAFQKIPFLNALAPTQSEPPFIAAEIVALGVFVLLGLLALRRFHPEAVEHSTSHSRNLSG